jgi:Mce-associated membrane protein
VRVDIELTEEDDAKVTEEAARQDADEATDDPEDVAESGDERSDEPDGEDPEQAEPPAGKRGIRWSRVVAFGVLPVLALVIAAASGFLDWRGAWIRGSGVARAESLSAAKDSTVAILSYQPDSVERDLGAARDRLTGKFKDSYTQLVHDVVIPGAKKDHISAVATVPAAASVSADPNHAVALVFVNQTVTVGNDAPTGTSSTVRVTLDKNGDRWLISAFDPI